MVKNRGQTSIEFLVILAAAMVILTIVFVIAQGQTGSIIQIKDQTDARNTVLDLSAAAKQVYAQGEGSKKQVYITLPSSYEASNSFVSNKSIRVRAAGSDYASLENFNVRGYLPATTGGHWVWVVSEGNRVRIGDAMMELDRNRVYLVMGSNSTADFSFSVLNTWVRTINISTTTQWEVINVAMDGIPVKFILTEDANQPIDLEFAADADAKGIYLGQIDFVAIDNEGNTENVEMPITVDVIPYGQEDPLLDLYGPLVMGIYHDPTPVVKYHLLSIYANVSDRLTGNNTIKDCQIDSDGSGDWHTMLPTDGAYDEITEIAHYNYSEGFSLGPHTFQITCMDSANNTGPSAYYYINVSESDTLGPIIVQLTHTGSPTTLTNITITAVATEEYTGKSTVQNCTVKMDSGSWQLAVPDDGTWNEIDEAFTYNVGALPVGLHTAYARCTDSLGNLGGIFNDSFGIVDVDLMLVLDRSGSMLENVTDERSSTIVSTNNANYALVKTLTVTQKNGDMANLTTEIRAGSSGCTVTYNVTINGITVATGARTSTSYGSLAAEINVSNYTIPYQVSLYLKRNIGGCTVYNRYFSLQQSPTKMNAVKISAKSFLDVAGSGIQAGLVSFSTSATTDDTLALMNEANMATLKNSIDALNPVGSTCLECGLESAANELTSARARPTANKVIVMLTDGIGNVGDSVAGAVYCRDRNITVFTIGLGDNVDSTELTNIALLTHGSYYFAPDVETLNAIFQSIGRYG